MNWLDDMLPYRLAVTLAIGVTCWLGLGVIVSWFSGAPLQIRFAGRAAIALAAGWAILTVMPLPRWAPWSSPAVDSAAAAATEDTAPTAAPIGLAATPLRPLPEVASWPGSDGALRADPTAPTPQQSAASQVPADPRSFDDDSWTTELTHWAVIGWAVGALITSAWLLIGVLRLALALRRTNPAPAELLRLWRNLPDPAPRRARVRLASIGSGPYTAGVWRRTVVIPADLLAPHRQDALRHVLLHERAHLRAGDVGWQWLTAVAMPLLWAHPLFWVLRNRARLAAELLADDAAAQHSGATAYVRSLIDLASRRTIAAPTVALTMVRTPSEFYRRMESLMNRNTPLSHRTSRIHRAVQTAATALLFVGGVVTFGTEIRAQSPELRELRQQVQELRAENDRLRVQLEALRKEAQEAIRASSRRPSVDLAEPLPGVLEVVTEVIEHSVRVETAPTEPVTEEPVLVDVTPESVELETVVFDDITPEMQGLGNLDRQHGAMGTGPAPIQPVLDTATLDLITRCVDQRAQIELARVRLDLAAAAVDDGTAGAANLRTAEVELQAAERKFALLRSALDAEIAATKATLERRRLHAERTRMLYDAGRATLEQAESAMAEPAWLQARLDILIQAR